MFLKKLRGYKNNKTTYNKQVCKLCVKVIDLYVTGKVLIIGQSMHCLKMTGKVLTNSVFRY